MNRVALTEIIKYSWYKQTRMPLYRFKNASHTSDTNKYQNPFIHPSTPQSIHSSIHPVVLQVKSNPVVPKYQNIKHKLLKCSTQNMFETLICSLKWKLYGLPTILKWQCDHFGDKTELRDGNHIPINIYFRLVQNNSCKSQKTQILSNFCICLFSERLNKWPHSYRHNMT